MITTGFLILGGVGGLLGLVGFVLLLSNSRISPEVAMGFLWVGFVSSLICLYGATISDTIEGRKGAVVVRGVIER